MSGKDIKQINDIARKYKMTDIQRKTFGKFLEKEKAKGRGGSQNLRGDYTFAELDEKARQFLNII